LRLLGTTQSERIDTLVTDLVRTSEDATEIGLSEDVFGALDELRDFMFSHVYLRGSARVEQQKAIELLGNLFTHFLQHPDEIPAGQRRPGVARVAFRFATSSASSELSVAITRPNRPSVASERAMAPDPVPTSTAIPQSTAVRIWRNRERISPTSTSVSGRGINTREST